MFKNVEDLVQKRRKAGIAIVPVAIVGVFRTQVSYPRLQLRRLAIRSARFTQAASTDNSNSALSNGGCYNL